MPQSGAFDGSHLSNSQTARQNKCEYKGPDHDWRLRNPQGAITSESADGRWS